MKKYTILILLFALGCHSSAPNGVSPGAAAIQNINVNPAVVTLDTTLGCQSSIPVDQSEEIKYSDLIDGHAGLYTVQSATLYSESQPNTKKNANFVLQNDNLLSLKKGLTPDQKVSCFDLTRADSNTHLSSDYEFPYEINRADGKVLSDADLGIQQISKDGNALTGNLFASKIDPIFSDLKSFISSAKPRHAKQVHIFRVSSSEVHILIIDKFVTHKGNQGIKIVLGVYKLSGT